MLPMEVLGIMFTADSVDAITGSPRFTFNFSNATKASHSWPPWLDCLPLPKPFPWSRRSARKSVSIPRCPGVS